MNKSDFLGGAATYDFHTRQDTALPGGWLYHGLFPTVDPAVKNRLGTMVILGGGAKGGTAPGVVYPPPPESETLKKGGVTGVN